MLAEFGHFSSFVPSGDFFKPVFTIVSYVAVPILVFSPYRNSCIEFHDTYLSLPSLFIPPFNKKQIKYTDVVSIKNSTDENGYTKIKLKLKSGMAKINSHYCYDKTIFTFGSPDEFFELCDTLEHYISKYRSHN